MAATGCDIRLQYETLFKELFITPKISKEDKGTLWKTVLAGNPDPILGEGVSMRKNGTVKVMILPSYHHTIPLYKNMMQSTKSVKSGQLEDFIDLHNNYYDILMDLYRFNSDLTKDMAAVVTKKMPRTVKPENFPDDLKSTLPEPLPPILRAYFQSTGWETYQMKLAESVSNPVGYERRFCSPITLERSKKQTKKGQRSQLHYDNLITAKKDIEGNWSINQEPEFDQAISGNYTGGRVERDGITTNDYLIGLPNEKSTTITAANKGIQHKINKMRPRIIESRNANKGEIIKKEILKMIRSPDDDMGVIGRILRPRMSSKGKVESWDDIGDYNALQYLIDYLIDVDDIDGSCSGSTTNFLTGGLALGMMYNLIKDCEGVSEPIGTQNKRCEQLLSELETDETLTGTEPQEKFSALGSLVYRTRRYAGGKDITHANIYDYHGLKDKKKKYQEAIKTNRDKKKKEEEEEKKTKRASAGKKTKKKKDGSEEQQLEEQAATVGRQLARRSRRRRRGRSLIMTRQLVRRRKSSNNRRRRRPVSTRTMIQTTPSLRPKNELWLRRHLLKSLQRRLRLGRVLVSRRMIPKRRRHPRRGSGQQLRPRPRSWPRKRRRPVMTRMMIPILSLWEKVKHHPSQPPGLDVQQGLRPRSPSTATTPMRWKSSMMIVKTSQLRAERRSPLRTLPKPEPLPKLKVP